MLTQCPKCQTVFRVTSTILRAAHGQVRCGSCNTQFDAIEHLLEGAQAAELEQADKAATDKTDNASPDYSADSPAHEDIVLEGTRIEISGVYRSVDAADENDIAHARTIIEEFNVDSGTWESPFKDDAGVAVEQDLDEMELDDVEQELNAASLAEAIANLDAVPTRHGANADQFAAAALAHLLGPDTKATASVASKSHDQPRKSSADPFAEVREQLASHLPLGFDEPADFLTPPEPTRRWPWLVASLLLLLVLSAQAVHHSRTTLARQPSIGPQLTTLYAALGQPLPPQWQLQSYSIKQWGIISDPQEPGTLRVRASVTNGARFAQPYPLLRLSLEDRFGSAVGSRSFKPDEYLGSSTQAQRLLAAGEAANIDLALVDPGVDAVGFQFDTCLPLGSGMQCTHDLPAMQQ